MHLRALLFSAGLALITAPLGGCWHDYGLPTDGGMDGGVDGGPTVDGSRPDPASAKANPFMGSGGMGYAFGSAFPGASVPRGMAKPGPDTSGPWGTAYFLHFDGYWYEDDTVRAFSQIHLHGTGAVDYGALGLMPSPVFDADHTSDDKLALKFQKANEHAEPGSYDVTFDPIGGASAGIHVELTATPHISVYRFTFPEGDTPWLVVNLDHHLENASVTHGEATLDAASQTVHGVVHYLGAMSDGFGGFDLYYALRTKQPWTSAQGWSAGVAPAALADGTTLSGAQAGFALRFDAVSAPTSPVEVQVGLSFVSEEGAAANLDAEAPRFDFDGQRAQAAAAWQGIFDRVRFDGGSYDQRATMLSALHHCFLMPSVVSDVDGSYRGHDKQVHHVAGADEHYVTELSLWDTYRTTHPLYSLIAPEAALDAVRSLVRMYDESGRFPKWPLAVGDSSSMVGAGAEVVIADAYLRGVPGFDSDEAKAAYDRLRPAAMDLVDPPGGRGGRGNVVDYINYGYVPSTVGGSVSVTTELAHDDFAMSQLAGALGLDDDAAAFLARSKNYRNLFDPQTGFLWAKTPMGRWAGKHDSPTNQSSDFVEANAWQSVWMAAHDVDGLATLMGGRDAFIAKLTEFFEQAKAHWDSLPEGAAERSLPLPYYWAGNEPDIQAPWMFAQAGRPDLTQKWVKWAMATFFNQHADGLPGNDDGGAMAAWYVYGALGFYPIPGSDIYILGAPLFPHIEIEVAGGTFTIDAPGVSDENLYVQSATLNDQPLTSPILKNQQIISGGKLELQMGPNPSDWGRE